MADKVVDLLRAKYLISPISYEGLIRKEELEYPEPALREAILNAIVHKDYTGTPAQVRVFTNLNNALLTHTVSRNCLSVGIAQPCSNLFSSFYPGQHEIDING